MNSLIQYFLVATLAFSPTFLQADDSKCLPKNVGEVIEKKLNKTWNKGSVKAWDVQGEMWSMPLSSSPDILTKGLKENLEKHCFVEVSNQNSYTVRIKDKNYESKKPSSIVSDNGTTLGVFSPAKGELILMMYPAKIAASIAQGRGTPQKLGLATALKEKIFDLDIEYQFSAVEVKILSGQAKGGMRELSDAIFRELRKTGFNPMPDSERAVKAMDSLIVPESHESFWNTHHGIARIELKKLKKGQISFSFHESKDKEK